MPSSFTISWDTPQFPPEYGYRITYWPVGSPGSVTEIVPYPTTNSYTFTGLANQHYEGTIQTLCSSGNFSTVGLFNTEFQCPTLQITVVGENPTNLAGNNGTATVTDVIGGSGNYAYAWSNGQTTGTATGLLADTIYTVTVTDTNTQCTGTASVTIGQTNFSFDADYMMITYQFNDGQDMDTRTRIVSIDGVTYAEQNAPHTYMGWSQKGRVPETASYPNTPETSICDLAIRPLAVWGGDNVSTSGFESIVVDFTQMPVGSTEIVIDCRAYWYSTLGLQPVILAVTLWKGGCPIFEGYNGSPAYSFTNPTATQTLEIGSAGKVVTAYHAQTGVCAGSDDLENPNVFVSQTRGQRVGVITYNRSTNVGTIDINDVTTPAV